MSQQLKILFFSHDAFLFGATRSLIDLILSLRDIKGIKVKLIIPYKGPLEELLKNKDIDYEIIQYLSFTNRNFFNVSLYKKLRSNLKSFIKIRKLNKTFNPNWVYFNTSTNFFPIFYFYLFGKKSIIHIREYGYEDYNIIHDFHGFFYRCALKIANLVLTNSFALKEFIETKDHINCKVLYNGVCSQIEFKRRFLLKKENSFNDRKKIVLGVVGAINRNKGQDLVLSAYLRLREKIQNIKLHFYGDGELKVQLEKEVLEYNLPNEIVFKGFVNSPDEIYKEVDIIIVSSKYEAFGRVAIEAISYGIPVIGLDNGGTAEILRNERGILFDGSKEGLQNSILTLINNPDLKNTIIENGWKFAIDNFSYEIYCESFLNLINKEAYEF